ncbi:hypothetical protein ACQUY5_18660 [Bacillus cereus]|uniref:hypothetical protein n=1 Tax=Bacillus cereus TaxID=1396 RepID=UPI003D164E13
MMILTIADVIQTGKIGDKFRIIDSSNIDWVDLQITIVKPKETKIESAKDIRITDLPLGWSSGFELNSILPLVDAVLSAEFIKEENEN